VRFWADNIVIAAIVVCGIIDSAGLYFATMDADRIPVFVREIILGITIKSSIDSPSEQVVLQLAYGGQM
jgi:hypothetical protein